MRQVLKMDLCFEVYGSIGKIAFTAQKKIFDHLAKLADVRCLSSEEQEKIR